MIGTYRLRDLEEILSLRFPTDEFDTVRGFLINELGRVPKKGESATVKYQHLVFEVEETNENRIETVLVTVDSHNERRFR
ncbi:MAG: transporter associated domain-containing protein [Alkalibacterium sp.]|nr:transporter associated domain-containing protein [Alkalibacterium sp.]